MKFTRRQFGTVATAFTAGLMLPGFAQANTETGMRSFAAPAPGKNTHPLLAKRDQKAILTRIIRTIKLSCPRTSIRAKPK